MTPKEKAEELVGYYWLLPVTHIKSVNVKNIINMMKDDAKKCALHNLNQMLWVAEWYERRHKTDSVIKYLNEVKTEIEKL